MKSKCGRFTAPLRCLLCDFTTQASHDAGLDYEQQEQVWSDHSDLTHPLVRVDPERARLEREVIEAIKSCRNQDGSSWEWLQPSGAYGPEVVNAWNRLRTSLDALIDFESSRVSNA